MDVMTTLCKMKTQQPRPDIQQKPPQTPGKWLWDWAFRSCSPQLGGIKQQGFEILLLLCLLLKDIVELEGWKHL